LWLELELRLLGLGQLLQELGLGLEWRSKLELVQQLELELEPQWL